MFYGGCPMNDYKTYNHLSFASSLCGNCSEVCPVHINIHNMIHYNRTLIKKRHTTTFAENTAWRLWKLAMKKRSLLDMATPGMKTIIVNQLFKKKR